MAVPTTVGVSRPHFAMTHTQIYTHSETRGETIPATMPWQISCSVVHTLANQISLHFQTLKIGSPGRTLTTNAEDGKSPAADIFLTY